MRNFIILLASITSTNLFASSGKVTTDWERLANIFDRGHTLSFHVSVLEPNDRKLVVTCNGAYGLVGLAAKKYSGYNRIHPAKKITPVECERVINKIRAGSSIVFAWKKANDNDPWGLKYLTKYVLID